MVEITSDPALAHLLDPRLTPLKSRPRRFTLGLLQRPAEISPIAAARGLCDSADGLGGMSPGALHPPLGRVGARAGASTFHWMSTIEIETEKGAVVLPESYLLVALDETGHEEMPDGHPAFGLGGCAMLVAATMTEICASPGFASRGNISRRSLSRFTPPSCHRWTTLNSKRSIVFFAKASSRGSPPLSPSRPTSHPTYCRSGL